MDKYEIVPAQAKSIGTMGVVQSIGKHLMNLLEFVNISGFSEDNKLRGTLSKETTWKQKISNRTLTISKNNYIKFMTLKVGYVNVGGVLQDRDNEIILNGEHGIYDVIAPYKEKVLKDLNNFDIKPYSYDYDEECLENRWSDSYGMNDLHYVYQLLHHNAFGIYKNNSYEGSINILTVARGYLFKGEYGYSRWTHRYYFSYEWDNKRRKSKIIIWNIAYSQPRLFSKSPKKDFETFIRKEWGYFGKRSYVSLPQLRDAVKEHYKHNS